MAKLCCSRPPASSRRARTPARSTSASSGTSCALSEDDGAEPQDRHPLPKPRVERSGVGQKRGGRPPEGVRKVVLLEAPLSHATERLMISRMTVVLLRPISLAIWTGVHLSWRRKSMRFLSPIVICFAMSAFLSLCLPPFPVRTRGRREGVTA